MNDRITKELSWGTFDDVMEQLKVPSLSIELFEDKDRRSWYEKRISNQWHYGKHRFCAFPNQIYDILLDYMDNQKKYQV